MLVQYSHCTVVQCVQCTAVNSEEEDTGLLKPLLLEPYSASVHLTSHSDRNTSNDSQLLKVAFSKYFLKYKTLKGNSKNEQSRANLSNNGVSSNMNVSSLLLIRISVCMSNKSSAKPNLKHRQDRNQQYTECDKQKSSFIRIEVRLKTTQSKREVFRKNHSECPACLCRPVPQASSLWPTSSSWPRSMTSGTRWSPTGRGSRLCRPG